MILVVAATEMELKPFLEQSTTLPLPCRWLVTGVGLVETTLRLTKYLSLTKEKIDFILNFGVGGAYIRPEMQLQPDLLDICFADKEVAGDLGVCLRDRLEYLDPVLTGELVYPADDSLLARGQCILAERKVPFHAGVFVSVNSITGTLKRGQMLQVRWNGLCENMEGAAVARVCHEFSLPWLELRCISNMVEDRDPSKWRLQEACEKAAHTAVQLMLGMIK